jgi:hypothetical protein
MYIEKKKPIMFSSIHTIYYKIVNSRYNEKSRYNESHRIKKQGL